MPNAAVDNVNVESAEILITPEQLKAELPLTQAAIDTVTESREVIRNILSGKDKRVFVVVGPCSIHDTTAAID